MTPITKKQIQLIKIAQKQLGIDDDTYREMLQNAYGVSSCTRLTIAQAKDLVTILKEKGFVIKSKNPPRPPFKKGGRKSSPLPGNVVKIASAAQHDKIAALSRLIDWRVKEGLTRWLAARFSIERVKTAQEAFRVIEGLKKMFENQMKSAYGERWIEQLPDDDDVRRYVVEHHPK